MLDRTLEILRQRFCEPLRLGEIAQAVDMTPFQLIGLFKREFGLTPYALLTQIRLNAACSLMKTGKLPSLGESKRECRAKRRL